MVIFMMVAVFVGIPIFVIIANICGVEFKEQPPKPPPTSYRWGVKARKLVSGNWGGEEWGGDKKDKK